MPIKVRILDALNPFSARPCAVVSEVVDATDLFSQQWSRLGDSLFGARSAAQRSATDPAAQLPTQALARFATRLQAAMGVGGMRPIIRHPYLPRQGAGFECLNVDIGGDVLRQLGALTDPNFTEEALEREARQRIEALKEHWQPRLSHYAIQSAERLGIPWRVVTTSNQPVFELGHGIQRRLFWKHITPETSNIGVAFSTPKDFAGEILQSAGLPIPLQGRTGDVEKGLRLAQSIGWPVVLKPTNAGSGVGVTTDINDEGTFRTSFAEARRHGDVLVQRHVLGDHYRLLVHRGQTISAARTKPAQLEGDGAHSIEELIDRLNQNRTDDISPQGKKIQIDDNLRQRLTRHRLSLESIPYRGQPVVLGGQTNMSKGGTRENVTPDVHPANRILAEQAAAAFGLDLAGIDVISQDISEPLISNGGVVIEVNATPDLEMGEPENLIEDHIITGFFPGHHRGRIPVVACVGATSALGEVIAEGLSKTAHSVALTSASGVVVGGSNMSINPELTTSQRSRIALSHHRTEIAVLAVTPQDVLTRGIGIDYLSVAFGSELSSPGDMDAMDAMICLDRVARAAVVFEEDLAEFLKRRESNGPVWCITDDITKPSLHEVSAVQIGFGSSVFLKTAGMVPQKTEAPFELETPQATAVALATLHALLEPQQSSGTAEQGT